MIRWGKLVAAIVGSFGISAAVHADMMPVSDFDIGTRQSSRGCSGVETRPVKSTGLFDYKNFSGLQVEFIHFSPEVEIDLNLNQPSHTQPPQVLIDGHGSLSLCLSALIGLGLCSSAHCVKKLHLGFIPEWYHTGGPCQVGHSIAVNPGSICLVPACCFVQPTHITVDRLPQYRSGTIMSIWRTSQYTPDVLASRGPPVTC